MSSCRTVVILDNYFYYSPFCRLPLIAAELRRSVENPSCLVVQKPAVSMERLGQYIARLRSILTNPELGRLLCREMKRNLIDTDYARGEQPGLCRASILASDEYFALLITMSCDSCSSCEPSRVCKSLKHITRGGTPVPPTEIHRRLTTCTIELLKQIIGAHLAVYEVPVRYGATIRALAVSGGVNPQHAADAILARTLLSEAAHLGAQRIVVACVRLEEEFCRELRSNARDSVELVPIPALG